GARRGDRAGCLAGAGRDCDRYRRGGKDCPRDCRDDLPKRSRRGFCGGREPEYHKSMNCPPRVDAAMTAEWPDLVAELDRWGEAGRVAPLWWRDDDAVTATPQLSALLRLSGEVPLALAAIPALVRPELADALKQ